MHLNELDHRWRCQYACLYHGYNLCKLKLRLAQKGEDLIRLWEENNQTPYLAKNLLSNIAVFVYKDPTMQYQKYQRIYGILYKNGYDIGSRVIYGALEKQWEIIPK